MHSESGGIITGWLIKLAVSLAIVGLVAFEAGAIVVARVGVESTAGDAAGAAADEFARSGDEKAAEAAARALAEKEGATLESFAVEEGGKAIVVTVVKEASTVLVDRIGFIEAWAVARSTRRRGVT